MNSTHTIRTLHPSTQVRIGTLIRQEQSTKDSYLVTHFSSAEKFRKPGGGRDGN